MFIGRTVGAVGVNRITFFTGAGGLVETVTLKEGEADLDSLEFLETFELECAAVPASFFSRVFFSLKTTGRIIFLETLAAYDSMAVCAFSLAWGPGLKLGAKADGLLDMMLGECVLSIGGGQF
jgi:hypothetical protein